MWTRGDLPFSGCAIFMGGLSDNLIRRAQADNGNCSATFDDDCVEALLDQVRNTAWGFTATATDVSQHRRISPRGACRESVGISSTPSRRRMRFQMLVPSLWDLSGPGTMGCIPIFHSQRQGSRAPIPQPPRHVNSTLRPSLHRLRYRIQSSTS
ncbi:hypothetical protein VTN96DRAFT_170 [Rasamsonia emersonii]